VLFDSEQDRQPVERDGSVLWERETPDVIVLLWICSSSIMTLQIKIKVMYNIHQYNNEVRLQQQVKAEEERLTKYLHKH